MKKGFYTFVLVALYHHCIGQSLNGLWKGYSEHSIFVLNPIETILEIEVYNDSMITGVIHSYYKKERFDHTKVSGIISWKDSTISITETEEISTNITNKLLENCFGIMNLRLAISGNAYTLEGKWSDQSRKLFRCPTLRTWFWKKFPDSLKNTKELPILSRKTNIQSVIELDADETDSIILTLYDNSVIDNDTASVYFDDSLMLKSIRVSQKPIEVTISLNKKKVVHHIKLVAENLGMIPPNTALLIITTRKNRYSIILSSDYDQNAAAELFIKE